MSSKHIKRSFNILVFGAAILLIAIYSIATTRPVSAAPVCPTSGVWLALWESQTPSTTPITLIQGGSAKGLSVTFYNIGTLSSWLNSGVDVVGLFADDEPATGNDFDLFEYPDSDSRSGFHKTRVTVIDSYASSADVGYFALKIKAPASLAPGTYYINFGLGRGGVSGDGTWIETNFSGNNQDCHARVWYEIKVVLPPTATKTRTPTLTGTNTATPTETSTPALTITPTSTPTSTPTMTPTFTASPSKTATATVTNTTTRTVTRTPTQTPAPITITLTALAAHDGWVLESGENSNVGGTLNTTSGYMVVGDDAAKKQYRSVLSFNTSGLPDTATISAITLRVRQNTIVGGGNPVSIFGGFLIDMKTGFFASLPGLQVSDFHAVANKTLGPANLALVGGFYNFNLMNGASSINKLATNGGVTQIRLRFNLDDNNNAIANYLSLFSGNAPMGSQPQLVITYK